jgi:hypothetical protein
MVAPCGLGASDSELPPSSGRILNVKTLCFSETSVLAETAVRKCIVTVWGVMPFSLVVVNRLFEGTRWQES